MKRFLKWVLSALYGLVMIEVIIMISPFAFYWYSLYAPALQHLHRWRGLAWTEAFFLPHSVITTSSLLEIVRWQVGAYAFSIGVIAAMVIGVQVYSVKLLRRRVATSWLYSRIRHPFYLTLAVAGFGLLTIWPRIIILILYLGMLFLYFWLSRFEEKQMEAAHPEYADYRRRTAMFIPGNPGAKLFRLLFGWIPNRTLAEAAASVSVVVLVIGSALLVRRYTVGHSATTLLPEDRTFAIAVWPMPTAKIERVVAFSLNDPRVRSALEKESGAVFTAHLLPADYGMVNMFADVGTDHRTFSRLSPHRFKFLLGFIFPFLERRLKNRIMGNPQENFKVVFSRVDEPGRSSLSLSSVTDVTAKMTPVVIAEIKGPSLALQDVTVPPRRSFWGDITMPMF